MQSMRVFVPTGSYISVRVAVGAGDWPARQREKIEINCSASTRHLCRPLASRRRTRRGNRPHTSREISSPRRHGLNCAHVSCPPSHRLNNETAFCLQSAMSHCQFTYGIILFSLFISFSCSLWNTERRESSVWYDFRQRTLRLSSPVPSLLDAAYCYRRESGVVDNPHNAVSAWTLNVYSLMHCYYAKAYNIIILICRDHIKRIFPMGKPKHWGTRSTLRSNYTQSYYD